MHYEEEDQIEGIEEQLLGIDYEDDQFLEGLAARYANPRTMAKRYAQTKVRQALKTSGTLTRSQKLLLTKVPNLSQDEAKDLREGGIQLQDSVQFVRTRFSGANELVNNATEQLYGLATINNGKLESSMMVSGIGLKYASGVAGSNVPGQVKYTNDGNAVIDEILNGELVIYLGRGVIYRNKVSLFFSDPESALASNSTERQHVHWLKSPKLFPRNQQIKVELKIPEGSTMPTALDYYLEISFYGESLSPRVAKS